MRLEELTKEELIFLDLEGVDSQQILQALAERIAAAGVVPDAKELFLRLWEREGLGSTGIGGGVAIPHCKMKVLKEPVLAVGVTAQPIDFMALDGDPVQVFLALVSPENSPASHLQVLAAVSRWLKSENCVSRILAATDAGAVYRLVAGDGDEECS